MSNYKVYSNLADYIQANDKKLYDLLSYLDIVRRLSSSKSKITFMWPDKEAIKTIEDEIKSDPSKASIFASSFFILGLYCNASDFKGKTVVTIGKRNLEVTDVVGNVVNFKDSNFKLNFGKKAGEECKNFFPSYKVAHLEGDRKPGFAVIMSEGIPNTSKISMKRPEPTPEKTGNNEVDVSNLLNQLNKDLEYHYLLIKKEGFKKGFEYIVNEKLLMVINNAYAKKDIDPSANLVLLLLKCCTNCFSGLSFFALFFMKLWEFFGVTNKILEYLTTVVPIKMTWNDFLNYIPQNTGAAIFDKPKEYMERKNILINDIKKYTNPELIVSSINRIYGTLEESNTLDNIKKVFPDEYAQFIKANKGIAYARDEIFYLIWVGKHNHDIEKYLKSIKNVMNIFMVSFYPNNNIISLYNTPNITKELQAKFFTEMCTFSLSFNTSTEVCKDFENEIKGGLDDDDLEIENIEGAGVDDSNNYQIKQNRLINELEIIMQNYGNNVDITDDLKRFSTMLSEPM